MRRRSFATAIALSTILACNGLESQNERLRPEITNITVANAVHGAYPQISTAVHNPPIANLRVRSAYLVCRTIRPFEGTFSQEWPMSEEPGQPGGTPVPFAASLPELDYGRYSIQVTALLEQFPPPSGGPGADTQVSATQDFNVGPSDECYTFTDPEAGLNGWSFDGVYDGDSEVRVSPSTCTSPVEWSDLGAGGLLFVPIRSACFPSQAPEVSGVWRFDFVSPDLASRAEWQGIQGPMIRVNASFPVRVQPILTYVDSEGVTRTIAEGPVDDRVFHDVSSATELFITLSPPEGARLTRLRVRVFGSPSEVPALGAFVSFGGTCPLRGRVCGEEPE